MSDYIDTGDRVVIASDGKYKGKHGEVISNDGFGRCKVRLDDGRVVDAWNGADLTREAKP